jgi:hypothetical protein
LDFTGEVPFVQKSSSSYEVNDFRFLLLINNKTTASAKKSVKARNNQCIPSTCSVNVSQTSTSVSKTSVACLKNYVVPNLVIALLVGGAFPDPDASSTVKIAL